MPSEVATQRVARLLTMVPFFLEHEGISVEEAASHFGISTRALRADLATIFVSGTPGYLPDDLIEVAVDDSGIHVGNVRGIERPLRLSPREVTALVAGLKSLLAIPGLPERSVASSALEKLTRVAGHASDDGPVEVTGESQVKPEVVNALRRAIREHQQVELEYVDARDRATVRVVDAWRMLSDGTRWYLWGWCHLAGSERHFRVDRVVSARSILNGQCHAPEPTATDPAPWTLDRKAPRVMVTVGPGGRWLAESVPTEEIAELPDGALELTLRVRDQEWFARLLLRLGTDLRAVSPPLAIEQAANRATAALSRYEQADALIAVRAEKTR